MAECAGTAAGQRRGRRAAPPRRARPLRSVCIANASPALPKFACRAQALTRYRWLPPPLSLVSPRSADCPPHPSAMADDEIQRVLFVSPKVHIYAVPPLTSRGYRASDWNVDSEKSRIFTARVRIIETATRSGADDSETVRTDVRLEDPKTGDLFANCPYDVGVAPRAHAIAEAC